MGSSSYGIGIGSDAYVNAYLTSIEEDIKEVAKKTCSLLEDDLQKVVEVHAALKAFTDLMKTEFVSTLDLALPVSAAGDND